MWSILRKTAKTGLGETPVVHLFNKTNRQLWTKFRHSRGFSQVFRRTNFAHVPSVLKDPTCNADTHSVHLVCPFFGQKVGTIQRTLRTRKVSTKNPGMPLSIHKRTISAEKASSSRVGCFRHKFIMPTMNLGGTERWTNYFCINHGTCSTAETRPNRDEHAQYTQQSTIVLPRQFPSACMTQTEFKECHTTSQ